MPRKSAGIAGNISFRLNALCPSAGRKKAVLANSFPSPSTAFTNTRVWELSGFTTATPVEAVAGDWKRLVAEVDWAETPCWATPFAKVRNCTTACRGSEEIASAHPITVAADAPVLVNVAEPCGTIKKSKVETGPFPKSIRSSLPESS